MQLIDLLYKWLITKYPGNNFVLGDDTIFYKGLLLLWVHGNTPAVSVWYNLEPLNPADPSFLDQFETYVQKATKDIDSNELVKPLYY